MSETRYFIVRGRNDYSIEYGEHKSTELQRKKPKEFGQAITYSCEVPENMTLKEAIRLYENERENTNETQTNQQGALPPRTP